MRGANPVGVEKHVLSIKNLTSRPSWVTLVEKQPNRKRFGVFRSSARITSERSNGGLHSINRGLIGWWGWTDTPTDILPEGSASCVQSFDDSLIVQFA